MKTKTFAILSDIVLVAVVLGGAVLLFASGIFSSGWNTDRPLLPLVVDWSRILLLAAAVGTVLGVLVAALVKIRRDRVVNGRVVRYSGFDRIVHWSIAIGFVLDFFTAIWLLRWLGLQSTPDIRPTLYLIHFIGAVLIVLGGSLTLPLAGVLLAFIIANYAYQGAQPFYSAMLPDLVPRGEQGRLSGIAAAFGYVGVFSSAVLFGKALETGELRNIPSAILNLDGSPESNVIVTALSTYDEIQIRREVATLDEAQALLARGKIKAAIIIPNGFMRQIESGGEAQLQLLLDGTDNISAPVVEGVAERVIQRYNTERAIKGLWERGVRPDRGLRLVRPIYVQTEIRFNPGLQFLSYVMPGVIGLTLQLLTVMLMAISITRERERGTLDQLMASPISRTEVILGKVLPYFGISLVNVATILFVADRWFNVPAGQNLLLLLVLLSR